MRVTMRSDDSPDVGIEANEFVRLNRLDQHIRTLQTARRWLKNETDRVDKATKQRKEKEKTVVT